MKKIIILCFLGGLCPFGSEGQSKVAFPASTPVPALDTVGQGSGALIYGELINPDSLHPVELVFSPLQLKPDLQWEQQTFPAEIRHGEFFDGILDPRVKKFSVRLPQVSDAAYMSLKVGGHTILENFLVFPSDSVMVGMDLSKLHLVFGGPQAAWFEAQYQLQLSMEKHRFVNPRILFEFDREKMLATGDNRKNWEKGSNGFGSRLMILEQGKDGLDWEIASVLTPEFEVPARKELEEWKGNIPSDRFELLRTELVSGYLAQKLSSLRRYGVSMSRSLKDSAALAKIGEVYPEIQDHYSSRLKELKDLNSAGYLNLVHEWVLFQASIEQKPAMDLIIAGYEGEERERLLFTTLYYTINRSEDPQGELTRFGEFFTLPQWRSKWENLCNRYALNRPLIPAQFRTIAGDPIQLNSFSGKPVLLYFYFSTCTHSANFFKNYLWPLYEETSKSAGYKLIAVSIDNDPELWKNSIPDYSHPELTNLNLPSKEWRAWLDYYLFTGYPRTILLDTKGNLLSLRLKGENYEDFKARFLKLLENSGQPATASYKSPINP
ncbi:MAG: thioredoxin family protein [Algoriphagus sp.]|nr:thioredoxin family protein [Algoriphagus sp.]